MLHGHVETDCHDVVSGFNERAGADQEDWAGFDKTVDFGRWIMIEHEMIALIHRCLLWVLQCPGLPLGLSLVLFRLSLVLDFALSRHGE
jgi:hypothetical protein